MAAELDFGAPRSQAAQSAYDRVRAHLERLAARHGLAADAAAPLLRAFDVVCRRALAFTAGGRVPQFSRINADGTPFQLAAAAGPEPPALEFLGDPGWDGATPAARLRAGRASIAAVARLFAADAELARVQPLLRDLAPGASPALLRERAGTFWIGAGAGADSGPALRVYVNGAWGDDAGRWSRLDRVAAYFGAHAAWHAARCALPAGMKPLGAAVTIARGRAAAGRIYLSAYGLRIGPLLALACAVNGERFAAALHGYVQSLLRRDAAHPLPTAVCSFGLAADTPLAMKVELCCHCLFASDAEARERLDECFAAAGADARAYAALLDVLAHDGPDDRAVRVHSFAGIGARPGAPGEREHYPVYLQPALGPRL